MRTFLILIFSCFCAPAAAQDDASPPPCTEDRSERVDFATANRLAESGDPSCVTIEGLLVRDELLDGTAGYYARENFGTDDLPPMIGLYGDREAGSPRPPRPTPARVTGRLGHCQVDYDAVPEGEIVFFIGFCHYVLAAYMEVGQLEITGTTPVRSTGPELRNSMGQLIEPAPEWPYRNAFESRAAEWLRIVKLGDREVYRSAFDAGDDEVTFVFDGENSVATRLKGIASPQLRVWSTGVGIDEEDLTTRGAVACYRLGNWTDDRWPVAFADADVGPNRPYACIRLYQYEGTPGDGLWAQPATNGLGEPTWDP